MNRKDEGYFRSKNGDEELKFRIINYSRYEKEIKDRFGTDNFNYLSNKVI